MIFSRLLKALGMTDEEIAELFGILKRLDLDTERSNESGDSCSSLPSSSEEYMSADGFYLMNNFKYLLTKGLTAVVSKKPWNPAEYLGHWLLNYKVGDVLGLSNDTRPRISRDQSYLL